MQKSQNSKEKVHMISLGCPKNLVDAEMMLGKLSKSSYEVTESAEDADTIIVNTCSFIEDSRKESIQNILDMADLKQNGKLKKLVVSGCLPQRYKDEIVDELPEVDYFVGSGEFQNIDKILKQDQQRSFFHLPTYLQTEETPRLTSGPGHRAYLKISEGCKKRCAFCAIPKIRGNLQSRELRAVLSEAKLLAASGVKELIVISHDFTDYGWDLRRQNPDSPETSKQLLKDLAQIQGIEWVRVLYMYPDGIDQELIDLMKSEPKLIPYFDIPLQHINDRVLKSMNRKMTRKEIESALSLIRRELPDAVIRTQFIVGFPGETAGEFQELLEFVKDFRFDRVGCFQYSPEEKTAGARMENQVDEETKQLRHDLLMSAQKEISREMHQRFIGQTLEVMVEGLSLETDLLLEGRFFGQAPEIDGIVYINDGQAEKGQIYKVRITDAHDYDLVGEIL